MLTAQPHCKSLEKGIDIMESKLIFTPAFVTDLGEAFEHIYNSYGELFSASLEIDSVISKILNIGKDIDVSVACPFPFDILGYKCIVVSGVAAVFWSDITMQKVYFLRCFYGGSYARFFGAQMDDLIF